VAVVLAHTGPPGQGWWHRRRQGPDQDAVVDDVRPVAVQPQRDAVTGQSLAHTDVAPGEPDQSGGVNDALDLDHAT
jgi:hypothetical protein